MYAVVRKSCAFYDFVKPLEQPPKPNESQKSTGSRQTRILEDFVIILLID
jgi:hypothetical protein